jgi:tryptophan-rich sensory protein
MTRSLSSQLVGLVGWLLVAFLAAAVGAIASVNAADFYAQLNKPSWAFAWHRGALAAAEVLILLALIVLTVRAFWSCSRLAAVLLAPYLLWVGFASALTWAVWRANPGLLS